MSDPKNTNIPLQALTPEQLRARKRRNVAIGITIGLLTVLFYLVTIAKLGPGMFNRPL